MSLRVVVACDVPSCEREAVCRVVRADGSHVAWHCRECMDIVEDVFASIRKMVDEGTPFDVATRWGKARL